MSLRLKVYGLVALLALAGGGYYITRQNPRGSAGCASKSDRRQKARSPKRSYPGRTRARERSEIAAFLSSTANLRALREVTVSTQAEGIVQKVLAEEGDFVKEGQVLCSLDDTPVQIRLQLRRRSWSRPSCRRTRRRSASRKRWRRSDTRRPSSIAMKRRAKKAWSATKKSLLTSTSSKNCSTMSAALFPKRRSSGTRWRELEAEIAQSKLDLSRTEVRAPFPGFVTPRTVNIGQRLKPMDNLFNLGAFSPLFADVHLSERDTREGSSRPGRDGPPRQ